MDFNFLALTQLDQVISTFRCQLVRLTVRTIPWLA